MYMDEAGNIRFADRVQDVPERYRPQLAQEAPTPYMTEKQRQKAIKEHQKALQRLEKEKKKMLKQLARDKAKRDKELLKQRKAAEKEAAKTSKRHKTTKKLESL